MVDTFKREIVAKNQLLRIITPRRIFVVVLLIIVIGAAYENKVLSNGADRWPPPRVDTSWVRQFMGNVSRVTGISYVENSSLDILAKERFDTAVLKPDITHFGADTELPQGVGEVIYYPVGYSPLGYVQGIEFKAPIHWKLMASLGFTKYGYFLGQGQVAQVSQNCPAPELSGPNINVTQFFANYSCSITWTTSAWLVIDLSK